MTLLYSKKSARRLTQLLPQADVRVLEKTPHALIGMTKSITHFLEY